MIYWLLRRQWNRNLFPNSAPLNSGLWLGAFGKVWLFRCQSRSFRPTLLPPLQPWFVKETAFFSAKAQKLKNSAKPNSGTVCRFTAFAAFAIRFCQRHCVSLCKGKKLKNSAKPNSGDCLPVSAFASGNSYFINSLVQKLQNSAQAEFWDCTPVLAFETGIFFRGFG